MLNKNNKFQIGNCYKCYSFSGNIVNYKVLSRTDNQIVMSEYYISEEDGKESNEIQKFDIIIENGIEKILVWEYNKQEVYIYANEYV